MTSAEFEQLKEQTAESVAAFGKAAYERRTIVAVRTWKCIETQVLRQPGVYWIETNMPVEKLQRAISKVTDKNRKIRKNAPKGTEILQQKGTDSYVAYSGTEVNLQKRLGQHLFNRGNADTQKLACLVDEPPFNEYKWQVSFTVIKQDILRYAVESWWRLEHGWPAFCLR
ncbi:hypothetical protein LFL96_28280 [Paraburkholderia sp. D15]|uniref:hypothetical protein n=1 Tax=Paraburkholderia sp. D15 TaxID=2880218 RepID=UPI002479DAFC|nr:hypothetical protein [Paraburkholderia sp. D15]WGS52102.1 hypothetical protein LFL96_28280 [Paraburkholderia sp. D15]